MFKILENINDKTLSLNPELITFWEDCINVDFITDNDLVFNEIDKVKMLKWTRNLRGLLVAEMNIPEIYVYPNIRINNLTNFEFTPKWIYDHKGLYLIKSDLVESLYEQFLIKYKKNKD